MELIWLLACAGACDPAVVWSHGRTVSAETLGEAAPDWRAWLRERFSGDGYGDGGGCGLGSGYGDGPGDGYGSGGGDGSGGGYGGGYGSGGGYGGGYGDGGGYGSGGGYGADVHQDITLLVASDGTTLTGDVKRAALARLVAIVPGIVA